MTSLWTTTELDIVETLTRRVRLLSLTQAAQIWWPDVGSQRIVARQLRRLREAELLLRTIINAHPRLSLRTPLATWKPGADAPNFAGTARRIKARWKHVAEPTEVYWASPLAANLFGSTARELPELAHRDHDLLLGEVYVLYRTQRPQAAHRWLGENVFPKAGYRIKDPDAFLVGDDGQLMRVIESAGRYGSRQVESFHEHCVEYDLSYELW